VTAQFLVANACLSGFAAAAAVLAAAAAAAAVLLSFVTGVA